MNSTIDVTQYQMTYDSLKANPSSSVAKSFCAAYTAYRNASPLAHQLLMGAKQEIELALEGWQLKILIPDEQLQIDLQNALFIVTNLLSKPTTPLQ